MDVVIEEYIIANEPCWRGGSIIGKCAGGKNLEGSRGMFVNKIEDRSATSRYHGRDLTGSKQ